ncbi:MAG: exopolysaccharide synthesis protein ExoD [Verrucomicrobiota bacterium]|jgi:hypothetical protein
MNSDDPYKPPLPSSEEVLDPISADLRGLLARANGGPLSLHDIEQHLKDRGYALLVLFLAAPFPIPNIPGLSVPFGIAICFIGWAFMIRSRPRLPDRVMKTTLEFSTLQRVVPFIANLMEKLERWTKPRQKWLATGPAMTSFIGLGILSGGFFLALPLPIPLTNGPPALSIIFLVVGMLCRDGVLVVVGHVLGILSWVYLGVWIYFGKILWPIINGWIDHMKHWF